MRTMHLFAGAGGGLLGDLILGHEPIIAVEWDKYACQVLRERAADGWFPNLSVWEGDVRLFDPSEYAGRVDCIHAGFPCQDISVAGKQAGVGEETRSGLYREVLRISDVVRPRILFLENVAAIINNGLGTVLGDLSARGYFARWICIRASDVGANHGRDRWWLLARHAEMGNTEHDGCIAKQELRSNEASSDERRSEESQQARQLEGADRPIDVPSIRRSENGSESTKEMANSDSIGHLHGKPCKQSTEARIDALGYTSSSSCDVSYSVCERLQGFVKSETGRESSSPQWKSRQCCGKSSREIKSSMGFMANELSSCLVQGWWKTEPDVGRVTDVTKDRASQLKALGNAQVPLQAATAFAMLMELSA